jgi:hypothetical protein
VDVNVTAKGVPVLRLKTIEPQDAADDGITPRRIHGQDLSREAPRFEDCASQGMGSDFLSDSQESDWSGVAVWRVSDAELGS